MQQANAISYGAIGHVANNPFAASAGLISSTPANNNITEEGGVQSATNFTLPKEPSFDENPSNSYQMQ